MNENIGMSSMFRKIIIAQRIPLLAFIFALFTSGCNYNPFYENNRTTGSVAGAAIGAGAGGGIIAAAGGTKPFIAIGAITGGMFGYYVTTLRHQAGAIIDIGGNVYTIGDYLGIYIPSDYLFEPNTAVLLPQSRPVLDSAAAVLARYPNNNVIISGNTSGFYRTQWEQHLSERRARVVSAYMWKAGINNFKERSNNMRKLNYVGYGDFFPIAQKYTNRGIRANSRIQITSYPSDCDLHLDRLRLAVHNMGATSDDNLSDAIACDASDPYCVEPA